MATTNATASWLTVSVCLSVCMCPVRLEQHQEQQQQQRQAVGRSVGRSGSKRESSSNSNCPLIRFVMLVGSLSRLGFVWNATGIRRVYELYGRMGTRVLTSGLPSAASIGLFGTVTLVDPPTDRWLAGQIVHLLVCLSAYLSLFSLVKLEIFVRCSSEPIPLH